jgi:polar amino acid transport system substrate-binding protein
VRRLILALAGALILVACQSGTGTSTGTSTASGSRLNAAGGLNGESAFQRILRTHVLRVATLADQPPWESVGPNNQLQGFDIDIANSIAKALGAKAEFTIVDTPGRIAALQAGKVDVSIGGLSVTPARAQVVDFTDSYLNGFYVFAVLKSRTDLNSVNDLNQPGRKIAVVTGSFTATYVPQILPKATESTYQLEADQVQAVGTGQADAFIEGYQYTYPFVQSHPNYKMLPGNFAWSPTAFGVQKGDQEWLNWLNVWIRQFNCSGDNERSFQKWFNFPIGDSLPKDCY